jgi:hypothetical protein
MPSLNLDYAVPGYLWGGSYKIALQAGNATAYQKISFSTVKWKTPATALTEVASMLTTFSGVTGGQIHPAVQALFNKKGTTAAARLCRGTPAGTTPLNHALAGQARLTSLVPGTPTLVDVTLFAGTNQATMLRRAFTGQSLNIQYALVAPSAYTRYIGVGPPDFVGASTSRPADDIAAVCLPPSPIDPIGPVLIPNPLAPIATPTNPGTFTLANGDLTKLADRVPVLRTIIKSP